MRSAALPLVDVVVARCKPDAVRFAGLSDGAQELPVAQAPAAPLAYSEQQVAAAVAQEAAAAAVV